jgi:hypothetical protein
MMQKLNGFPPVQAFQLIQRKPLVDQSLSVGSHRARLEEAVPQEISRCAEVHYVGLLLIPGLERFLPGVTSRALRLKNHEVRKAKKCLILDFKTCASSIFNNLGARSTGYARFQ